MDGLSGDEGTGDVSGTTFTHPSLPPRPGAFGSLGRRLVDLFADISPAVKAETHKVPGGFTFQLSYIEAQALHDELHRLIKERTSDDEA